jgi:hypothetical protein
MIEKIKIPEDCENQITVVNLAVKINEIIEHLNDEQRKL